MMFCLLGVGGVSGSGFFCYVELFLSVPEGGQMKQFKEMLAFKVLCKYDFNKHGNWRLYLCFVNFVVYDVY